MQSKKKFEIVACVDSIVSVTIEIPLTDRVLLESSVLLTAHLKNQNKVEIACTENLTLRSLLKIGEYCSYLANKGIEAEEKTKEASSFTNYFVYELGIFGTAYLQECLIAATILDFKVLKEMLKQALEDNLYPS